MELNICVWNWADYNEGNHNWKWFALPEEERDLLDYIIGLENQGREEFFICDSEHSFISENDDIYKVIELSNEDESELSEECLSEPIFEIDEMDYILEGYTPSRLANMIHFGNYSPTDDYFTFNGYGNVKTLSEYERDEMYKDALDEAARNFLNK